MSLFQRMQNVDRRIIYTGVFIVLAIPLFNPLGLPLGVTRETRAGFDFIDQLPERSTVFVATAIGPAAIAELEPQTIAVLKHMADKNLQIILGPMWFDAPLFVDRYAEMLSSEYGYVEGVDFIRLPFLAGQETLWGNIGASIKSAYSMQQSSPLWDSISHVRDLDLVVTICGGESQMWALAHVEAPHGVPVIACITAVILAVRQPYFASGQLTGLISGMDGAAGYEILAGHPGTAAAGMDAQSLGHLWIVVLVLLGNVAFLGGKPRRADRIDEAGRAS